jgi:diguanylate cyclase (GGDEF)-like protein
MPNERILLVDDDPLARAVFGDALTALGYEVLRAASAEEASDAFGSARIDVVVTDLILPGADGLSVLSEVKRRDPHVEVIVITAVDRVGPAVKAIKSGASDYLVKPVTPESLELAVSRCLAKRKLLHENALLRSHLSLMETGQRLATCPDKAELFPLAVGALAEVLSARGAVLFAAGEDGGFATAASHGLTPSEGSTLAAEAMSWLASRNTTPSSPASGEVPRVLQVEEAGELFGVCLFAGATAESLPWSAAGFLSRHLALALKNLRRLSAAEELAHVDDVTGLHNARYLQQVLDRQIDKAKQSGAPFAVLFLDLDHFKSVNDTHGHLVGSRVLAEVGTILRGCVRGNDVVARYGGDEYVLVLVETETGGALKVGERIRRTIESHRFAIGDGVSVSVTASIGLASYPEHAATKQILLECADRAMYRGKAGTRNVVYVASPA